ncbi:A/G-specific adenine glycosylase [Poseidonocella sedimentorum]|uniref:Adenine DNA glycosylase n=1 Tax=Poseidonocella sedimentorum TaxID=871652 RepID=A0A1I6EG14_9RHOB|nr:A/G-specific adenine glycosylase [Poseidonocella sedimentorum]SFR16491.1 A/G-specific DNA-adenine glycosylase [Poseidonocella sedimentorum]
MRDGQGEGRDTGLSRELLGWYDAHARALPWRVGPAARAAGEAPDPYRVWLSEIMLQQTTVAAVKAYFDRFTALWPTVGELAAAEDARVMGEWAGLGYYARARNLLKCARIVAGEHGGAFPRTIEGLRALPGIGPYTAAAIGAIAFDLPATVVDGNVERVMARLHNDPTPLPAAKPRLTAYAAALTPKARPGDYAQAVMDLGATVCTPRNPACGICPWRAPCAAQAAGTAAELPKKTPKQPKPVRLGIAYVALREDGAWLLERRPDTGLLGGMLGWPGSDWGDAPQETPPLEADWIALSTEARHTFTHFHLRLSLRVAHVPLSAAPSRGQFLPPEAFRPSDLPTVMRKVFDLAATQRPD